MLKMSTNDVGEFTDLFGHNVYMDDSKSSRENGSANESGSKLCMGLVKDYGWLLDVVEGNGWHGSTELV
ncbi:hypothetical protein Tco_1555970 [Tanacetum coccineum]